MSPEHIKTPEKITFKKITPDDWEKYQVIKIAAFQTDAHAMGGSLDKQVYENELSLRERLSSSDRSFYGVEVNSAFIAKAEVKKVNGGSHWKIIGVYTMPDFRGKQYSTQLLMQIINDAETTGADKVSLLVNVDLKEAIQLYTKLGFKIIESKKEQLQLGDGKIHDLNYMEKVFESAAR